MKIFVEFLKLYFRLPSRSNFFVQKGFPTVLSVDCNHKMVFTILFLSLPKSFKTKLASTSDRMDLAVSSNWSSCSISGMPVRTMLFLHP